MNETIGVNIRRHTSTDLTNFSAIMAEGNASIVSQRYRFIPTMEAVKILENMGWLPTYANQAGTRKQERQGFQKHVIRFRHETAQPLAVVDTVFPEIIMGNSHDGESSFWIRLAFYRVVCCNGNVIGDTILSPVKVRHVGFNRLDMENAVNSVASHTGEMERMIREFKTIDMHPDDRNVFAAASLLTRFGKDAKERDFDLTSMLRPKRVADQGSDLWATYNVVQEKLIRGGQYEYKRSDNGISLPKKVRGINSVTENVRINKELWDLAEKFARSN